MSEQALAQELFDPDFLSRLQQFSLKLTRGQKGGRLAEQRTTARGQGLEFADYKPYTAGDDLRAIDWNIYQRLGKVFVRVFEEQQDMPVYFLLDVSNSMFMEQPPRITAGLKTALALAAIALGQQDSVGLFPFSEQMQIQAKSVSGKSNIMRVAQYLAAYQSAGSTALAAAVQQFSTLKLRPGLLVIVSDFFDQQGIDAAIQAMKQAPHKLLLVQLTKKSDANPLLLADLQGELRIEDGETQLAAQLTITPELVSRYQQVYQEFNQNLSEFARSYGAGLVQIDTEEEVLEQLATLFEGGGLVL